MPMPTLTPVAEDEIVRASENGRRPTIVPPPVTAWINPPPKTETG